jgi:sulfite reductase (NADPH) hemoprotein beta-component
MSAIDDSRTLGRTRLSFASEADIDEFVDTLEKFERGELTPDQWRAFRLVRGTYGQRQTGDVQMLRVKIPQGILTARQLEALAQVGDQYSRGFGHITTRQNVQFHFVTLHDVEPAMRQLADAGLTTREACGNSVRNITACQYAGVAADEVFDVTPYADAMTRYLLRHRLSSSLPRKFKIAFEGCADDHAIVGMHDLGFRALERMNGSSRELGFRVVVGGGTSIMCKSAAVLYDFLPANDILNVAEAIIRVFHKYGDYKHKQRNRMKFMMKDMGWERWKDEFGQALTTVLAEGGADLPFDANHPPVEQAPDWESLPGPSVLDTVARATGSRVKGPGITPQVRPVFPVMNGDYSRWLQTNVRPQKQNGYVIVGATVPLGDLTSEQMRVIADLAGAYSDSTVRVSADQNLFFRWVRKADVGELYRRLSAAGLGLAGAEGIADVTSCPGAESCKLAVTQSRGLGRLLGDFLRDRQDLANLAPDLKIKISGCPNGCGRHHVAGLGFQGSVRKLNGRAVPQYFLLVGGGPTDTGVDFGRLAAKIPARRLSETVVRLLHLYRSDRRPAESATDFFRRVTVERVKEVVGDLERLTMADALPEDFIDLAESTEFNPEIQEGECSA